ncbi:MAG: Peptidase M28 [uncultured Sulfurovum sp.]|uniref:Peptidase M28 n=1 Tax=uncultured Sulfurovum sp. TaxID=269237 RepID=A0A6S6TME8_9BACT|nr:MAG: Peptidase M28 [uncultured Sulfurovum sp.]
MLVQPTWTAQSNKDKVSHISAINLKEYVYTIVQKFDDRIYNNLEMLDATAKYLHDEFSNFSKDVSYQTYVLKNHDEAFEYKNVIVNFKGTNSSSDELVIIGAHYDTFGGHAGANDNTSAVAALLELARVLKSYPPKYNTQIVAYTLEEPPAFRTQKMGSFIHAKRLSENGVNVKVAIVLDMIGFYSDEPNSQNYPVPLMDLYYPKTANFISVVSNLSNILEVREAKNILKRTSNLPVYSMNAPAFIPGIDFSDHHNYWKFGYPSFMISDTAFYRSENYHAPKDTPDTLDYERMAKVVEGVFNMVKN